MAEEIKSIGQQTEAKSSAPPKKKGTSIPKGTTGEELARQISKDLAKAGTGKGLEADVIGSIVGKSISKVIVKKNRVGKSSRGIVRYKPDKGTQPASDRPLMSAVGSAPDTTPGQQDLSGQKKEKSKSVTSN
tara:strand:- start:1484 stop:1879 length:396 start_codon:yes stop_codon:yes gene_type:complete